MSRSQKLDVRGLEWYNLITKLCWKFSEDAFWVPKHFCSSKTDWVTNFWLSSLENLFFGNMIFCTTDFGQLIFLPTHLFGQLIFDNSLFCLTHFFDQLNFWQLIFCQLIFLTTDFFYNYLFWTLIKLSNWSTWGLRLRPLVFFST